MKGETRATKACKVVTIKYMSISKNAGGLYRWLASLFLITDVYKALNNGREKYTAEKLTATFHDRNKYVVHFANLKYYLQQGLVLKKVHRVLAFRQTAFLRIYMDWCTLKRQNSLSKFSKNLYKLLANRYYEFIINCLSYKRLRENG